MTNIEKYLQYKKENEEKIKANELLLKQINKENRKELTIKSWGGTFDMKKLEENDEKRAKAKAEIRKAKEAIKKIDGLIKEEENQSVIIENTLNLSTAGKNTLKDKATSGADRPATHGTGEKARSTKNIIK